MKRLLLLSAMLMVVLVVRAQSVIDNAQVNGSFQTDAQFYMPDEGIDITSDNINGKKFAVNGFGKISYSLGNFSAESVSRLSCHR